jgi:hypothetical protein
MIVGMIVTLILWQCITNDITLIADMAISRQQICHMCEWQQICMFAHALSKVCEALQEI